LQREQIRSPAHALLNRVWHRRQVRVFEIGAVGDFSKFSGGNELTAFSPAGFNEWRRLAMARERQGR